MKISTLLMTILFFCMGCSPSVGSDEWCKKKMVETDQMVDEMMQLLDELGQNPDEAKKKIDKIQKKLDKVSKEVIGKCT